MPRLAFHQSSPTCAHLKLAKLGPGIQIPKSPLFFPTRLPPSSKGRRRLELRDPAFGLSEQLGTPLPPEVPHSTHSERLKVWAGILQPEPQSLRETPPLPSLSVVIAPAHSPRGWRREGRLGKSAPSATERAGLHQPRSLGQRRLAAIARSRISAAECGWGSPARPHPALPSAGSAAASDGPGTQKPQRTREKRCGAEYNPSATRGVREEVGEEGGAGEEPRGRGEYPRSADSG